VKTQSQRGLWPLSRSEGAGPRKGSAGPCATISTQRGTYLATTGHRAWAMQDLLRRRRTLSGDKSLGAADLYRDEIMKQLVAARAVIAIWSPNSIERSERDSNVVSGPPSPARMTKDGNLDQLQGSLDLVRQVRSYARLYERTRLRMRPSHERTVRMEEIASNMPSCCSRQNPIC
jgi:hypothetical protein